MSLDVGSMPPWRQELLQRKRRQEDEERRRREQEEEKLSHMPSWKRDILLKKQQQKHNVIFISQATAKADSLPSHTAGTESTRKLSKSKSPSPNHMVLHNNANGTCDSEHTVSETESVSVTVGSVSFTDEHETSHASTLSSQRLPSLDDDFDGTVQAATVSRSHTVSASGSEINPSQVHRVNGDTGVGEEHLLPVQQNPWLRTDLEKRRRSQSKRLVGSHSSSSLSNHASCTEADYKLDVESENTEEDNVFQEDAEVAYGRGFVHKLLRKFSHLSVREEKPARVISARRTHSSDNILDDSKGSRWSAQHSSASVMYPHENGDLKFNTRARSMENLSSRMLSSSASSEQSSYIDEKPESQLDDVACEKPRSPTTNHTAQGYCLESSPRRAETGSEKRSSSSKRNSIPEEELPKSNIVSNARNVFEGISGIGGEAGYKKKRAPERPPVNSDLPQPVSSEADRSGRPSQVYSTGYDDTTPVHITNEHDIATASTAQHIIRAEDNSHESAYAMKSYGFKKAPSEALDNVRAAGKSWHFSGKNPTPPQRTPSTQPAKTALKSGGGVTSTSRSGTELSSSVAYGATVSKPPTHGEVLANGMPHVSQKPMHSTLKFEPAVSKPVLHQSTAISAVTSTANSTPASAGSATAPSLARKRQAPPPPQNTAKHASLANLDDDPDANIPDTSYSQTQATSTVAEDKLYKTDSRRPDTSKLNLNLDLTNSNSNTATNKAKVDSNANLKLSGSIQDEVDSVEETEPTKKVLKRPSPAGPGKLLIRPASNLIVGGPSSTEYLKLTNYHDVKKGQFAPARKRPAYYDWEDGEEIPITNIDDVIGDDIPITNIDDLDVSAGWRQDANENILKPMTYVFEGAGVIANRSLLRKSKPSKQLNISFNEDASSLHEYPSEQFLLATIPPQPGDYDYPESSNTPQSPEMVQSPQDLEMNEPSTLKTTPGMGSTGALSSYRPRHEMEFIFGLETTKPDSPPPVLRPQAQQLKEEEKDHIRPADEDVNWSDNTSADMLF